MRPLAQPGAGPVYAALVTPKGKLLHDLFVFRADAAGPSAAVAAATATAAAADGKSATSSAAPERLWLDVDAAGAPAVLRWLSRYKLRRPITIEDASGELSVWARGGGHGSSCGSGCGDVPEALPQGWWTDPRLPGQLGHRGVFPLSSGPPADAGGGGWQEAGEAEHRLLRYGLGVAEGTAELPPGAPGSRVVRLCIGCTQPCVHMADVCNGSAPMFLRPLLHTCTILTMPRFTSAHITRVEGFGCRLESLNKHIARTHARSLARAQSASPPWS
jgi:hypothetical protein